jgi:hypothetical protein
LARICHRRGDRAGSRTLKDGDGVNLECRGPIPIRHGLTSMQIDVILPGGLINWRRNVSLRGSLAQVSKSELE